MGMLQGLTILVPESRELNLFAGMLEAEGAVALRCPLVRIADLDDATAARAWIGRMIEQPFDYLVLLTGEGLRKLLDISGPARDALIAAVGKTKTVTRGPKPARALREIGLVPSLTATVPTSQGILETLGQENLAGKRVGVQLYPGDGPLPLLESLRARGAEIIPVTPYRYATQTEAAEVAGAITALAKGEIGMVAFTSSPQIERLFAVAREFGLEQQLVDGLARTQIAAIGPIMEQALAAHGLKSAIHPKTSFHLKPLVQAIGQAWRTQCA